LKSPYRGSSRILAWLHLILSNVGIIATASLVIYAGYLTGLATLPANLGGWGLSLKDVEDSVLARFLIPIAASATVTVLGIIFGGLGYIIVYRMRPKRIT